MQATQARRTKVNAGRPWISVFRRTLKSTPKVYWLGCVAITVFLIGIEFVWKGFGTGLSSEAPRWVSRLGAGLIWSYLLLSLRWGMQYNQARFGTHSPPEPIPWTTVRLEAKSSDVPLPLDSGSAMVQNGQLFYAGASTSFQVDLAEVEVHHVDQHDPWVTLWVPSLEQKFELRADGEVKDLGWRTFVARLSEASHVCAERSLDAPKPKSMMHYRILMLPVAFIAGGGLSAFAWEIAKRLPVSKSWSHPLIAVLLLAVSVCIALFLNLRYWHSQRAK